MQLLLRSQRILFFIITTAIMPAAVLLSEKIKEIDPNGPLWFRLLVVIFAGAAISGATTFIFDLLYNESSAVRATLENRISFEGHWVHIIESSPGNLDRLSIMSIQYNKEGSYNINGVSFDIKTFSEVSFYSGAIVHIQNSNIRYYYHARIIGSSQYEKVTNTMPISDGFAEILFSDPPRGKRTPVRYRGVFYDSFSKPFRMIGTRISNQDAATINAGNMSDRSEILKEICGRITVLH